MRLRRGPSSWKNQFSTTSCADLRLQNSNDSVFWWLRTSLPLISNAILKFWRNSMQRWIIVEFEDVLRNFYKIYWIQCRQMKMIQFYILYLALNTVQIVRYTHLCDLIKFYTKWHWIQCRLYNNQIFGMLSVFFYLAGEWWWRCRDRLDFWDRPTPDDADGHQTSRHQRTCQKTRTSRPLDRENIRGVLRTGMLILIRINILIHVNLIYM